MRIGIVGHIKRLPQVEALADLVDADYVSIDDGTLGAEGNHRKVWDHLATSSEWSIVLEDDAIPCDNFRDQLHKALTVAPTPIVSLYLGTGHPIQWQPRIRQAITNAGDASWLTHHKLLHAVGVAIRTEHLPMRLNTNGIPIDTAIGNWATQHHHQVGYTLPSLVDHRDQPTVIPRRYNGRPILQPRMAWQHGTRTHWTTTTAPL